MNEKTKLPFAEDDFLECVTDYAKIKVKILTISPKTNVLFVELNENCLQFELDKTIDRVNDGRFTVKAAG